MAGPNPSFGKLENLEQAASLILQGEKEQARELIRTALQYHPRDVRGWELLTEVCENQAELSYALERLLILRPDHPWAAQRLAQLEKAPAPPQESATPEPQRKKRRPLAYLFAGVVVLLLALAGFFALRGTQPTPTPAAAALRATQEIACQDLITRAMDASGTSCDRLGPNGVCYGNLTLKAVTFGQQTAPFAAPGDQMPIADLRSLSASPLNTESGEWGVAIFRMLANLPRSLPGEMVTLFVFGNTALNKDGPSMESFYFHSELGRIVCDQVPFDGIVINMPEGAGIRMQVNGTDLILVGNASLRAETGENLTVTMYSGSATVTSMNQSQTFGAGSSVQVPLGGADGLTASGPPSAPTPLSAAELAVACSLTGQYCDAQSIEALNPTQAAQIMADAMVFLATPANARTATVQAATLQVIQAAVPGLAPSATPLPSPTRQPTATRTPRSTPTRPPATPTKITPSPTAVPTRRFIPAPTRTPTDVPEPDPTDTPIPPPPTATQTASTTPTPTWTASPTSTATSTPTPPPTATSTATSTPTSTLPATPSLVPSPTAPSCSAYTISSATFSAADNTVSLTLNNNSPTAIILDQVVITWPDAYSTNHPSGTMGNANLGNPVVSSSGGISEACWGCSGSTSQNNTLAANSSAAITFSFASPIAGVTPSGDVAIVLRNGCSGSTTY